MNPREIARQFSRAVPSYDQAANIQRELAIFMDQILKQILPAQATVLEFGAGTGLLSQKLIHNPKIAHLALNDLSSDALAQNQIKLDGASIPFDLLPGDIQEISWNRKADGIVANAVIQWIQDLERLLQKFHQSSSDHGILCLSGFGPDNLIQIRESYGRNIGKELPSPIYLRSVEQMQSILQEHGWNPIQIHQGTWIQQELDLRAILRHFKQTGVSAANPDHNLSPSKFAQWQRDYQHRYAKDEGVYCTWDYWILACQKIRA